MRTNKAKRAELLKLLKQAVSFREQCWDAERDFEIELGKDVDDFDSIVDDFAAAGAESIDEKNLIELIDEVSCG